MTISPSLTVTLTESQRQSVVTLNTGSNSPVQITVAANSIHDLVGNVFAPLTNGALTITDDNTPPTLTDPTPNLVIMDGTLSFAFDEHINVSTISLQNISITDTAGTDTVLLTGATLPATNSSSFIIGLTTAQIQQLGTLTFDDDTPLQITVSPSAITDLTGNAFGGLVAGTAIDTTDDSTAPTLTSTTLNLDTAILVLTFNEAIVWSDTTLDNITITDSNNANPVTLTGANLTDNNLPTLTITLTESQRQSVVTLNTGSNSPVQITVAANSIHDLVGNVFASLTNGALTITDDNTPPTLTDPTPNLVIMDGTLSFAFDEHINVSTISLQNISITDVTGTDTVLLTGATLPATNSSSFIIGLTTAQIQQLGTLTFDDDTPLQITVSPSAITDLTGNAFGGLVAGTAIDTTDDSTAPTLTSTTLNLDTAILVLTFNEAIVWSDTTLDNITITDSNNANPVTLTGANLTDNNLPTLTITLTESQRQSVVTLNTGSNSPVQITVAANSIHDLVGNVFASLTNGALTITDDNTPPTLTDNTPNLNIAAATLSFAFDEHINVSTISLQNISITDATGTDTVLLTGATLPATNSSSFIIGLTTAQIQQLGTLTFDDDTPLQITVSPSAITDLTGNAFGGLVAGTAIDTTDDSTAPTLTSTTLNLDTAILVLTFNEAIVWSDTTLDNITITDSNNANPVTLTGANLTDNNLPTLTITLTESQRQSVVTLNTGSNSPVQITVAANSIHDLVGNVFAPLTNGALTITDDNTPPTLTDPTPNLVIMDGTLSFAFDEHINVSTISLQNISITDATGTDTVLLTGATLPATNSSSFIIGLTTAQIQQLGTLTFDDNTTLQITVSPSAITDLTGNAFGGLVAGTAIDTTDDSTAPTLTSTTLNLDTAILVLTFNEAIVWSDTTLDNITITDSNNANPVTLTGANLTDNNLPTLTITLTESQRQSVVTLNTGSNSPVQITVAANSIHDLVGNVFAPLTNGALTITDDNTPPTLTDPTPNLVIMDGTLSFAFDEHINVSTISLQNISITDTAGTDTVLLTGATLPATNSSSFIIGLTTAQIQQLGTLTFDDDTPLQITVSPSAITDLTGNAFGGLVAGTAIDTTDDSTAPTLTSTTLNLDTAILVLTFNEAIVWSDTTLDNITITDSNNANPVTLTGANLTDNNLPTLTITLTESQRQSVVTLNTGSNSPVQITVAANSIHDLVGNVFAPLTNGALTITDDNTPPTLTDNTPNLNIAAATLSFAFDEHINVSTISLQNISITDATGTDTVLLTGATLPATNSSSFIIGLTTAQIQQLGTLTFDDDTPLQITVSPSAITDLTGNAFGGLVAGTAIDTTDDSTAPTLTSTTLNLDTAILVLTFNEAIVWSDTTLDNITITDSNNANPVTLTGANLTDNNLPTLTITLTESQRQSVVTLNTGSNSPVQITVAANSIHDLVGNVFASLTNGALTITDDNTPPTLTDPTPNLDLNASTISFVFNETIDASATTLSVITITDNMGENAITITGLTLPTVDSSTLTLTFTLTSIQIQSIITLNTGANTPVQINVAADTIRDLSGNAFGGLDNIALTIVPDNISPILTLDGNTNIRILQGDTYKEQGAICNDIVDGIIPVVVGGNGVNTAIVGSYIVTYDCQDTAGNDATQLSRTVTVDPAPDTTRPTIMLVGPPTVSVTQDTTYIEEGATCLDDVDDSIPVIISGDIVDITVVGSYEITYNCRDTAGNDAIQLTRTVAVIAFDTVPPVLMLSGPDTLSVIQNTVYTEQGATCLDEVDGPITTINIGGPTVDTSNLVTYTVTYDCQDAAGNNAIQLSRTVTVIAPDNILPVISSAQTYDFTSVTLVFSEDILVNSPTAGDFMISGLAGSTSVSLIDQVLENTVRISFVGSVFSDTDSSVTLSYARTSGSINDLAGNTLADFTNIDITNNLDTTRPIPAIALDPPETPTPTALSAIPVTVTFSEPVSDLALSAVTVTGGTVSSLSETAPSDGTTYSVVISPSITVGTVSVIVLSDTVVDTSSNANVAATFDIQVDRVSPTVISAKTLSSTTIALQLSEPVTLDAVPADNFVVSGTDPSLPPTQVTDITLLSDTAADVVKLTLGATAGISDTDTLVISYSNSAEAISDASGNTLSDFDDFSITNNMPYPPAVSLVYATVPDGTYLADDTVEIAVLFTKPVTVTADTGDSPSLLLETGSSDHTATYAGTAGSSSNILLFRYTVLADAVSDDLQYHNTAALTLPPGTTITESGVSDPVDAEISLPDMSSDNSLASNSDIVIDGIPTQVIRAEIRGQKSLEVSYNRPVIVTTDHYTNLTINETARNVTDVFGSNSSNILVFFDGPPVDLGVGGTVNVNTHVVKSGQVVSPRSQSATFSDDDHVTLIASDTIDILVVTDETTTTTSAIPTLGLQHLYINGVLAFPPSLITATIDHNADGTDDARVTFAPDTVVFNFGPDQTVTLSISAKTVTPDAVPSGFFLANNVIIDLGYPTRDLLFDNPVIIDLVGRAGDTGLFIDAAGTTRTVPACATNHAETETGNSTAAEIVSAEVELRTSGINECSVDIGADLRIYSLHLSSWGSFTVGNDSNDDPGTIFTRNRNINGGGGGGGHGASTPPSFTTSFATGTDTITINGIGISPKPFRSLYVQDKPVELLTDRPTPFSFTLYDDESWKSITHLELCINKPVPNNTFCDTDTKVIWSKNRSNGTLEIIDENNVIDTANITVTKASLRVAIFDIDITFKSAVNTTDLQIRSWDAKNNIIEFTVENAFVVTDTKESAQKDEIPQTTNDDVPINDSAIQSIPDDPTRDRRLVISMWAGYHVDSATDAQLFDAFGLEYAVTLPDWFKSDLGSWVAQDRVSLQEFDAALQYLTEQQNYP